MPEPSKSINRFNRPKIERVLFKMRVIVGEEFNNLTFKVQTSLDPCFNFQGGQHSLTGDQSALVTRDGAFVKNASWKIGLYVFFYQECLSANNLLGNQELEVDVSQSILSFIQSAFIRQS